MNKSELKQLKKQHRETAFKVQQQWIKEVLGVTDTSGKKEHQRNFARALHKKGLENDPGHTKETGQTSQEG